MEFRPYALGLLSSEAQSCIFVMFIEEVPTVGGLGRV